MTETVYPQIQWLVKDGMKEIEALREEHNEIYNEITRCFGNEKCLQEFGMLDMGPGSKLHSLGNVVILPSSSSSSSSLSSSPLSLSSIIDLKHCQD